MSREKELIMRLVRCGTTTTDEDFHRRNTKSNSEYKGSSIEYIVLWMNRMNRIPILIIGPLYTSLWIKKNSLWIKEIMKLSVQNSQRWKSNESQQCETSAIKKQVKYHRGTAIQKEIKTP